MLSRSRFPALAFAGAALLAAPPALAVNKCIDTQGNVIYSDVLCPSDSDREGVRVEQNTLPGSGAYMEEAERSRQQQNALDQQLRAQQEEARRLRNAWALEEERRRAERERSVQSTVVPQTYTPPTGTPVPNRPSPAPMR